MCTCMYIQPLDTRDLNVYDKRQCREAYATVKHRVEVRTLLLPDYTCSITMHTYTIPVYTHTSIHTSTTLLALYTLRHYTY